MSKSPNHYKGRNGWKPDIIVCHITEGAFNGAVSWLCNPVSQCSSHFVIGAKGQSEQLVDLSDGAWCNGNSTNPTSRLYYKNSLSPIVRSRATTANNYTYSIEHEGYSYKDRFGALTEEQYQASLKAMKKIVEHMKSTYGVEFQADREHLIGHYVIDPKGKPSCPSPNQGANFPFDRFIADIKAWQESLRPPKPEDKKPVNTETIIQVGAFTEQANAFAFADKVRAKNFNVRVIKSGNMFKVQVVSTDSEAITLLNIRKAGFDGFATKETGSALPTPAPVTPPAPAPTPVVKTVKVGSKVKVKDGARSYEGVRLASFVYKGVYTVDELKGDRAVLDKKGICTPVKVSDLIVV